MDKGYSSINSFKSKSSILPNGSFESANSNGEIDTNSTCLLSSISSERLDHSNIGEYNLTKTKYKSGGHGQDAVEEMNKYKIRYEINRVYNNGVRVGNIIDSKNAMFKKGNNHTWFPEWWTKEDIKNAANHVVKVKKPKSDGKYTATYNGVKCTIIYRNGEVCTVFPNKYQNGGRKK